MEELADMNNLMERAEIADIIMKLDEEIKELKKRRKHKLADYDVITIWNILVKHIPIGAIPKLLDDLDIIQGNDCYRHAIDMLNHMAKND
jgi:hypothetical protein